MSRQAGALDVERLVPERVRNREWVGLQGVADDDRAWAEMILYLEDTIKSGKQARAFMLKASLAKNILVAYRDRMSDQECHYPVKTRTLLCGLTCLLAKKSIVVIDFLPADVL